MRVLFVCLGNICRSPIAEGVARGVLRATPEWSHVTVDSAGTAAYHVGDPPDVRAQAAALRRGVYIGGHRARVIVASDFEKFDLILAMDLANRTALRARAPDRSPARVELLLDLVPETGVREVPDPYYGVPEDFERVVDLAEEGARGLIEYLRKPGAPKPPR